jgi:DNA polymerase-3 subunit gamma/tau
MLDYLEEVCKSESVNVAPGVLSLVVRSGGGSVRDSLSLLDQLIAGSIGDKVAYERAVALLGGAGLPRGLPCFRPHAARLTDRGT